jgi:hypothetical protein
MMIRKGRLLAWTVLLAVAIGGAIGFWHWYAKPLTSFCTRFGGLGGCPVYTPYRVSPGLDDAVIGLLVAVATFAALWIWTIAVQSRHSN